MTPPLSPLIVVVGPTGSGKSELSLVLASALGGEIVNCDSIQLHRGLDVGSAKLSPAQRLGVPHHLLDVIEPNEYLTAGAYAHLARPVLSEIARRRAVPIVTGGTGLYLRALLDGLSPAPSRDQTIRDRLSGIAARRPAALHRFLARADPRAATRIHPNDLQKLIRAVELILLARQPLSETHSRPRNALQGFTTLKLGLNPDRAALRAHLDTRTERMFRSGLLEETSRLLAAGVSPSSKALQSLGYRQAVQTLTDNMPVSEAIRECQARTRQYAKRQTTWFRPEPGVHWFSGFGSDSAVQEAALSLASSFVSGTALGSTQDLRFPR